MAEEKIVKEIKKDERKAIKELKENPWIAATFVFAILALILLYLLLKGGGISKSAIGEKAVDFINTQLLQGKGSVTLQSVGEKAGLYEVNVLYQNKTIPVYFSKDGGYYAGTMLVPITPSAADTTQETTAPKEIVKSDKPKVELFVMSYCPYGTQAEKGIIPAVKALGNLIDFNVRFVHYTMHGEKEDTENFRQICIREEQNSKYLDYLSCFLASKSGSDAEITSCLTKTGINQASLATCINGKAKDYYAEDSSLSQGYGVQGSPTLVINGVEADFYPRSPASALKVICSAFNNQPAACSQTLSTANPDPGFGTTSTTGDSSAAASCS